MRFIVDECTGPDVANWLKTQGYEVFSVYDEARGIDDDSLIKKACEDNWILITNDKDFGVNIFRELKSHNGIILLRLKDERAGNKISILHRLLEKYSEILPHRFIVVSETQVRFARTKIS